MIAWILTFLALAAADICWAVYIAHVQKDARLLAAGWSVFIFLTGAVGVIGYTHDKWLLIPAAAGCFIGTYLGMWWSSRKK